MWLLFSYLDDTFLRTRSFLLQVFQVFQETQNDRNWDTLHRATSKLHILWYTGKSWFPFLSFKLVCNSCLDTWHHKLYTFLFLYISVSILYSVSISYIHNSILLLLNSIPWVNIPKWTFPFICWLTFEFVSSFYYWLKPVRYICVCHLWMYTFPFSYWNI